MNTNAILLLIYGALFPFHPRDKYPLAARAAAIATGVQRSFFFSHGIQADIMYLQVAIVSQQVAL